MDVRPFQVPFVDGHHGSSRLRKQEAALRRKFENVNQGVDSGNRERSRNGKDTTEHISYT